MPRRKDHQELLANEHSYSFQKLEGTPALVRENIVTQEELAVGDKVTLFSLPDGKYFISKATPQDGEAFTVGKITLAHIFFNDEITIEEV